MAVVSVRLNKEEEKVLDYLSDYFHEDKSTLFKKSMQHLYEDIQDIKFIDKYINKSIKKKPEFISGDDFFKSLL